MASPQAKTSATASSYSALGCGPDISLSEPMTNRRAMELEREKSKSDLVAGRYAALLHVVPRVLRDTSKQQITVSQLMNHAEYNKYVRQNGFHPRNGGITNILERMSTHLGIKVIRNDTTGAKLRHAVLQLEKRSHHPVSNGHGFLSTRWSGANAERVPSMHGIVLRQCARIQLFSPGGAAKADHHRAGTSPSYRSACGASEDSYGTVSASSPALIS